MIANINELAKFVKGGADVLHKAIESKEEVSLEFIEGSFVSDSDLEVLKESQFKAGKKEGETVGYDYAMKDIKKDYGIDIEGKDRKTILKALSDKILSDAKIEPEKKIRELNESIERLQNQYNSDIQNKDSELSKLNNMLKDTRINGDIAQHLPDGIGGLKPSHFVMLAKNEYQFDYSEDGSLVAMKNGKVMKDKMEKPIPVRDVLTDFATQNNWIQSSGRGGGHSNGGSGSQFQHVNDVYKYMESNGINPMSQEGEKLINDFTNSQKQ